MSQQAPIRIKQARKQVFLVDDHPVLRQGLSMVINGTPDLAVCGEAATAAEALAALRANEPDIAIIDLSLQEGDGLDLIGRVKQALPELPMLVLSAQPESRYAEPALRVGASGYLEKKEDIGLVVEAIRQILSGRIYLSEAMKDRMLLAMSGTSRKDAPASPSECLSERELVVFHLIGQGKKTRDIADELCISSKTVQIFRDRIREKLGLADGMELQHAAFHWANEQDR